MNLTQYSRTILANENSLAMEQAVRNDKGDYQKYLIWADSLEDEGDPRAQDIRLFSKLVESLGFERKSKLGNAYYYVSFEYTNRPVYFLYSETELRHSPRFPMGHPTLAGTLTYFEGELLIRTFHGTPSVKYTLEMYGLDTQGPAAAIRNWLHEHSSRGL